MLTKHYITREMQLADLIRIALTQDKNVLKQYIKENHYPAYALHLGDT